MRTAARTAFFMVLLTFISKCIGFVRELLLANFYGASYIVDAYVMATSIPGIIFGGVFAAISTAYMPVFSRKMETEGEERASRFTSEVINLALMVSIVAGIIGILLSDQIVAVFASGFQGEVAELTSFYVKITFSFVIFSSTMSLLETYLQYKGVFIPQVIAGYVQNIVIIIIIIISYYTSHYILVAGWLLGFAVRMIMMFILAKKKEFHYSPAFSMGSTIRNIIMLSMPVFIGTSINQINMFIDRTLASGLPEGSVAALNYGNILITMIQGLTISILVTISYPKLAQASSLNDRKRFGEILSKGINLIAVIAIPCCLGGLVYSEEIVKILYERGAFDATATALTSTAFFYYIIGLFFASSTNLITQAYYSMHNMKTPMIFAAIGVIINVIFNLILIRSMGIGGLALATSISSVCTFGLMYLGFKKYYPGIVLIRSFGKLLQILIMAAAAVAASWIIFSMMSYYVPLILKFGLSLIIAGIIYFTELLVFKVDEVSLLKQILKRN